MKKIVSLVAVLLLIATTLTACGGGISGKFKLTLVNVGGVSMEADGDAAKAAGFDKEKCYIDFSGKDSGKMEMMGETQDFTYTVDGKNITLTADGETINGTIDGNKLTIEEQGMKMEFEK